MEPVVKQKPLVLKVRVETHYGRETVYPACATSKLLAKVAGTKTLTPQNIELIKALGYVFENIYTDM